MNRVLPPGPREYWNELLQEQKTAAEHQKWMYESDPFEAKKTVETRQNQAAKIREETNPSNSRASEYKSTGSVSSEHPEVIMATSLRELVEDAIKEVC